MPTNKKISQLPVGSAINLTDLGVYAQDGTTFSFQFQLLVALVQASISAGAKFTFGTIVPSSVSGQIGDVFLKTDTAVFYQKNSLGNWSAQWAIPIQGDGFVRYGAGVPDPSLGKANDTYIDTSVGIFYSKVVNTWTQFFSMATGPQGPKGTAGTNGTNGVDGRTVLNGTIDPINSQGIDGDFYLNTSVWTMFGPKALSVWPPGQSLIAAGFGTALQIEVAFTAVSSVTINWQTDIPDGQTQTYFQLFANAIPKPLVFIPTDNPNEYTRIDFALTFVRTGGTLNTVTLDWTIDQTGIIEF